MKITKYDILMFYETYKKSTKYRRIFIRMHLAKFLLIDLLLSFIQSSVASFKYRQLESLLIEFAKYSTIATPTPFFGLDFSISSNERNWNITFAVSQLFSQSTFSFISVLDIKL